MSSVQASSACRGWATDAAIWLPTACGRARLGQRAREPADVAVVRRAGLRHSYGAESFTQVRPLSRTAAAPACLDGRARPAPGTCRHGRPPACWQVSQQGLAVGQGAAVELKLHMPAEISRPAPPSSPGCPHGSAPPGSMWKRMPRMPALVRLSSSASVDALIDHGDAARAAQRRDRFKRAAIVGAVGRGLHDHGPGDAEPRPHLAVVPPPRRPAA